MKIKLKTHQQQHDDGPHEMSPQTPEDIHPSPNEYSHIPEVVGAGQYDDNAKFSQKAKQLPGLKGVLKGAITVNEMEDQADDQTNFLGYTNDN